MPHAAAKSNRKPRKGIEPNPISLPDGAPRKMLPELDRHLASFFVLMHQYQKHHWLVEGPQFQSLHLYLGESYETVHTHADEIAERMTVLGGIPTSNPVEQARIAYIVHEEEGAFGLREMLECDLVAEKILVTKLRESIQHATEVGDFGTRHLLERYLLAGEDRAHHLDHYLAGDSLTK